MSELMLVLEYSALVVGVVVVLCLIYEKYWAWPLGVLFCFLTAPVMWSQGLFGYLTLTLVGFLPLNLYGWYYWLFGTEEKESLAVTHVPIWEFCLAGVLCAFGILLIPHLFEFLVEGYLDGTWYIIYLDVTILVLSLAAMWFTARKWIENWWIWLVVNVGTVALYAHEGLIALMTLYVLYIGMAVWGFVQWSSSMKSQREAIETRVSQR